MGAVRSAVDWFAGLGCGCEACRGGGIVLG